MDSLLLIVATVINQKLLLELPKADDRYDEHSDSEVDMDEVLDIVEDLAEDEEDAIVSFHIYDRDKLLAWEAIPWIALRPGYRTVKLRASPQHLGGNQLLLGSLFVHVH